MTDTERSIGRIEGRMDGLEERFKTIETQLGAMDTKLDKLFTERSTRRAIIGTCKWIATTLLSSAVVVKIVEGWRG